MRKSNLFIPWLLFVFSLFISCEKEVVLDFNRPVKLCLNCVLNPDSIVSARLTLSRNIENESTFEPVEGASIILYENEKELGAFTSFGNGDYHLNHYPLPSNNYKITVSHTDFQNLSASTVVPQKPKVTHNSDTIEFSEQGHFYVLDINYSIHDKPGLNNYWIYSKYIRHGIAYTSGSFSGINAPFLDDFNREIDTNTKYGFVYFYYVRISDIGYDGSILSFKMSGETESFTNFITADEHYDKYIKSSVKARLNSEGDLPFREPVQIYSNIENGYGIFGSCAITTIKL